MKKLLSKGWRPLLVIILLIICWEVVCHLFDIPDWLLPAPSDIFEESIGGWGSYSHHIFFNCSVSSYWISSWNKCRCSCCYLFTFNSIFTRGFLSIINHFAKYPCYCFGASSYYLVRIWDASEGYHYYLGLLFPNHNCSFRWLSPD